MSREAFEAWKESEGFVEGVSDEEALGNDDLRLSWQHWQSALAWAYEDAALVCSLGMYPEDRPIDYAYAIRERAKEVTR